MTMDVKGVKQSQATQAATVIRFKSRVPRFSDDQFQALLQRSGDARALDKEIRHHERRGRLVTRSSVDDMLVRLGYEKGDKPKVETAAVLAYYAQNKPQVFAADAVPKIVEYVEKVEDAEWDRLFADLEAFVDKLNEQRKQAEREDQLRKMRDKDDREHVQRTKIDPQKANGTKEELAAQRKKAAEQRAAEKREIQEMSEASLSEEITNGGKLTLSEVEEAQLLMLKKGFSKRE